MAGIGVTRERAWEILNAHLKNEKLIAHSLSTEVVLRALADQLGEDADYWGITGLLHDLDLDLVGADMHAHAKKTVEILEAEGIDRQALDAILRHNEALGVPRETKLDVALAAGETITGLIAATTLVYPSKDLADVKPKSVTKRMKEKAFAASVSRETIRECETLGIELAEFARIAVEAMREIRAEIGLDGRLASD